MTFLEKLKASLTLDRYRARATTRTDAEDSFAVLDRRLREAQPTGPSDPNLHLSIMRAVRGSDRARAVSGRQEFWRWAAATSVAAYAALCLWSFAPSPASKVGPAGHMDIPGLAMSFSQGRELTQKVPDAALAPLVGEMELLNRDVRSAVTLVVATMP